MVLSPDEDGWLEVTLEMDRAALSGGFQDADAPGEGLGEVDCKTFERPLAGRASSNAMLTPPQRIAKRRPSS